jgi:hypothetical protein
MSWRRIGYVTRDFLVIVEPQQGRRPDFEQPDDRIIDFMEPVNETVVFEDPDGDPIKVEYFGEIFDLPNNPMTVSPIPNDFTNGPLSVNFQWNPLPEHARDRPYVVHMKITDNPTDLEFRQSVTYKSWIISYKEIPLITGLPEQENQQFQIYPNPTKGRLSWSLPGLEDRGILSVFNLMGQQTISLDLTSYGRKEVDVSGFPAGLYFAEFDTGKTRYRKPFIKE